MMVDDDKEKHLVTTTAPCRQEGYLYLVGRCHGIVLLPCCSSCSCRRNRDRRCRRPPNCGDSFGPLQRLTILVERTTKELCLAT